MTLTYLPAVFVRFHASVEVKAVDECWLWRGPFAPNGYGKQVVPRIDKKPKSGFVLAHRLSYEIFTDEHLPAWNPRTRSVVLHTCDVKACVNPRHLRLGTQSENLADMRAKGRDVRVGLRGQANPNSYLTEDAVREIRRLWVAEERNQTELALKFGTTANNVWRIVQRKNWKHI